MNFRERKYFMELITQISLLLKCFQSQANRDFSLKLPERSIFNENLNLPKPVLQYISLKI